MSAPAIDKSKWGAGPWQSELDEFVWRSERGFLCWMRRHPHLGTWCGYVGVPGGHPWHGDSMDKPGDNEGPSVHGGITYANWREEPEQAWWVGFDCAHLGDEMPATANVLGKRVDKDHYRDAAYVRAEVERLALQAKEAKESK